MNILNIDNISLSGQLSSAPAIIALFAFAGMAGVLLGRIKIYNISIGVGGTFFSSLALGYLGFQIDSHVLDFIRDAGVALFVYAVGIQIGPALFSSFKKDGLRLNLFAAIIVSFGFFIAICFTLFSGLSVAKIAGVMSGAVTNTPGLGAAQQLILEASADAEQLGHCGLAYAVTYPFGIFGIIIVLLLLKKIFRINIENEKKTFIETMEELAAPKAFHDIMPEKTDMFALGSGIFIGILIGIIPLKLPGAPVPLKLGVAGGPLLTALILGKIGRYGKIKWTIPAPANFALREIGITLFLTCVGLRSGEKFFASIADGEGLYWMFLGAIITFFPLLLVGFIARKFTHMNFISICGLLSGSMTDPPALSFAEKLCASETPAISFTTVYATTMVLRIIFAQLIVILSPWLTKLSTL